MNQERLEASLREIRNILSLLHGDIAVLEARHSRLLLALERVEGPRAAAEFSVLLPRETFNRRFEELLEECRKAEENCGVLLIDIDHVRRIYHTHGVQTGDEVIRRVAGLLRNYESPRCLAGEFGGGEFAIATRGTDAEALGIAEMIRRGVERMNGAVIGSDGEPSQKVKWKCTLSIGMASTRKSGWAAAGLLKAANQALSSARRKGRNQVGAA